MKDHTVLRDSIDLLVTAVTMASLPGVDEISPTAARNAVEQADALGRMLWQENLAAHGQTAQQLPAYEWRPVLELIDLNVTPEQLLQIEKTRRELEKESRHRAGWSTSPARRLLDTLADAIADGLDGWPRLPRGCASDDDDYAGINQAESRWSRETGFQSITRPSMNR